MKTILVGVDGSLAGAAAVRWAGDMATQVGAEVVAVSAFVSPWAEMNPNDHERLMAMRTEHLTTEWIVPAVEAGAKVKSLIVSGDPRSVVIGQADAEEADLVVLGRTGKGGEPGFLHLGSVVEHAAHHVRIPLAVIPAAHAPTTERIILGVDGSPHSLAAVAWCAEVASSLGASVTAVTVEEPYIEWTLPDSPKNWRRGVEQQLEGWVEPLVASGVDVELIAQRDLHAADGLLGVAAARHADLLVVGSRGIGGFTGLRAGGVAMKILHRAAMPLVLVPPMS